MQLKELFVISTGYTFRHSIERYSSGEVGVIQAGDVNEGRLESIVRIDFDNHRHLLKTGDLVLSARGKSVARTITANLLPAVAASSVFILRPIKDQVLSGFAAHYLNSQAGQVELAKVVSGAYIKTLRKQELMQLTIPLPSLDVQQHIIQLAETIEAQNKLLKQKEALLRKLWDSAIATITKERTL